MKKRIYVTKDEYYVLSDYYFCPFRDSHVFCEQCTVRKELDCEEDFPEECPLEDVKG